MTPGQAPNPRGSVITVCFNAEATLETCIASIEAQTYPGIEYVVIDGGSTDGTAAILDRHAGRIDIRVSEPDRGIYDAMNKGIARATGEFVIFMNADDSFAGPRAVAQAVAAMGHGPAADVCYGSILVKEKGGSHRYDPPPESEAAEVSVTGCLPHQATFARRSVFDRTGPFDLRWRRHADYDWWMKVLADPEIRVRRIDCLVAAFTLGGASSDLAKGQPEVFAIQNAAALYRSPEWDRRRIELFQQAWLQARIQAEELRERAAAVAAATAAGLPAPPPPVVPAIPASLRARLWLARHLPRPVFDALRAARRRVAPRPGESGRRS